MVYFSKWLVLLCGLSTQVQSGTNSSKSLCLGKMLQDTGCVAEIMHTTPLDRFTCKKIQDIWECETKDIEDYCAHAEIFKAYTKERIKILFPDYDNCPEFLAVSTASNFEEVKCSSSAVYKMFTTVHTCGHLLPAVRPNKDACAAVDAFITDCLQINFERCYQPSNSAYAVFQLHALAQFLKSLASSNEGNSLTMSPCQDGLLAGAGLGGFSQVVQGLGHARETSEFNDDPQESYLTADTTSLVAEAIEFGHFPEDLLNAVDRKTLDRIVRMSAELLKKKK